MSDINGDTPSGETGGAEGINSSKPNYNLDHRQDLEKSFNRCANDLQDWFIAKGYDKLLPLNPKQLFKERVACAIKQNNPFKSQPTSELIFKSILSAHTKTKRIIENLYFIKTDETYRGDL